MRRRRTSCAGLLIPPLQFWIILLSNGFPSRCLANASMTIGDCFAVNVAFSVFMNLAETARSPFLPGTRWSFGALKTSCEVVLGNVDRMPMASRPSGSPANWFAG